MRLSENLARGAECPSWVQDCLSFVSAFGLVQFGADAAAYMHVSIGEEMEWKLGLCRFRFQNNRNSDSLTVSGLYSGMDSGIVGQKNRKMNRK